MEETLLALLLEVSPEIDPQQISSRSNLQSDLGLDSLKCMMLLMGIEDAFQVELDDSAIFETVGDVYDIFIGMVLHRRFTNSFPCQESYQIHVLANRIPFWNRYNQFDTRNGVDH